MHEHVRRQVGGGRVERPSRTLTECYRLVTFDDAAGDVLPTWTYTPWGSVREEETAAVAAGQAMSEYCSCLIEPLWDAIRGGISERDTAAELRCPVCTNLLTPGHGCNPAGAAVLRCRAVVPARRHASTRPTVKEGDCGRTGDAGRKECATSPGPAGVSGSPVY